MTKMSTNSQLGLSMDAMQVPGQIAVVVIGRNEGQRLVRCLQSVQRVCLDVVYVDSGSTDGSVEVARSMDIVVVELDAAQPFTAARARNAGIRHLQERSTPPLLVQVLDGDCELVSSWLSQAAMFLGENPHVGIVCGRRRERRPEASIYNRLCDMEWDTRTGPALACGGDALMRIGAFVEAGGFNACMIAGEDPEFSYRIRRKGWSIYRISEEMAVHDARMVAFGQWWVRTMRAGHAYAECFALHRGDGAGFRRVQVHSILFYCAEVPLGMLLASIAVGAWAWLGLAIYAILLGRVVGHRVRRGDGGRMALLFAASCLIAKFAQGLGILRYGLGRFTGVPAALIEYRKGPSNRSRGGGE